MFRVLWRFPLFGSGIAQAPAAPTYTESWSFPVGVRPIQVVRVGLLSAADFTETGHKET